MAVSLLQQRETLLPQPPLAVDTPSAVDMTAMANHDSNGAYHSPSFPTTRPSFSMPLTNAPEPIPISTLDNGRIYSLDVVQQPIRARMCGFGDKDRRPITPPPCIRLVVRDQHTNKELDINDIDTSYFVLTVDLWSADATKEVNLVRHSATSPSISAATSSSYPPPNDDIPTAPAYAATPLTQVHVSPVYPQSAHPSNIQTQMNSYQQQPTPYHSHQYPSQSTQPASLPALSQTQQQQAYYGTPGPTPLTPTNYPQLGQGPLLSPSQLGTPCDPRSHPSGMFTRNLIGSLCVSAFKLTDPENNMGVWFILQDLSVRTEGSFRLKMNFVNVGSPTSAQTLNMAPAPVLASCFSDIFTVYSAKKFPGVIESTNLSKCFATQGIKIPIRKDGVRASERRVEEDDE